MSKTWFISLLKDNHYAYYGPLSSVKVLTFLKNVYVNIPSEKEKKNFLIVDYERDIHFDPTTLYEILNATLSSIKPKEEEKVGSTTERSEKWKALKPDVKKRKSSGVKFSDTNYSSNSTSGSLEDVKQRFKKPAKKNQSRIRSWTNAAATYYNKN
jgi:hypothetical protein